MTNATIIGPEPGGRALQGQGAAGQTMPMRTAVSVNEPMSVLWQGAEYPVSQWNVHGFTLCDAIPSVLAPGRGRVVDVSLLIGEGETRLQMTVQARRDAAAGDGLSYRFIELGRAQAELLHRIVDSALTRQELSLTQLLNDTREVQAARHETTRRTLAFRTWFQVSLAGAALGAAAWMALGSLSTVQSRYAAVTAAAASVSAPAPGMVTDLKVAEGATVSAGDVLGYLRTPDHDARAEALAAELRALEAEAAELRLRSDALARDAAHADAQAADDETRLRAAVARAEQRLRIERAELSTLLTTGLPTQARQQHRARQQAAVLAAETDLDAARAELAALSSARSHGLAPGRAADALTPETAALRMAHLTEEIALGYQRDAALTLGAPVISPCDCAVAQITRVRGEWAEPAQPLFVMAKDGPRAVHALVLADRAGRITEGARARIELADGRRVSGRVTRLSYDTRRAGVAGLQTEVFAAERYARVEITPDAPLDADVGLTGSVSITTIDPLRWVRARAEG